MTQPSLNNTFDTSLVDLIQDEELTQGARYLASLNASFSTTETDFSENGQPAAAAAATTSTTATTTGTAPNGNNSGGTTMPAETTPKVAHQPVFPAIQSPRAAHLSSPSDPTSTSSDNDQVRYTSTVDAYNAWASVYDTDGNILTATDDLKLATLLPTFLDLVVRNAPTPTTTSSPLRILDLGCGTGRSTAKLLSYPYPSPASITGYDSSAGMLSVAREKLTPYLAGHPTLSLTLTQHDPFSSSAESLSSSSSSAFHAALSTLVLEHIPLIPFFTTLHALLAPGGLALVTNMHPEMGARSQAGFISADGVKVRGESYAHGVAESLEAARMVGFDIVPLALPQQQQQQQEGQAKEEQEKQTQEELEVHEHAISEDMIAQGIISQRGRKWIGCHVWYGFAVQKRV